MGDTFSLFEFSHCLFIRYMIWENKIYHLCAICALHEMFTIVEYVCAVCCVCVNICICAAFAMRLIVLFVYLFAFFNYKFATTSTTIIKCIHLYMYGYTMFMLYDMDRCAQNAILFFIVIYFVFIYRK